MRNSIKPLAAIHATKNPINLQRLLTFLFILINVSSSSQIITTVAGNGTQGYSGDGGPALNARLGDMDYTYPAIDNAGNIYIVHNSENIIRKVDAAGIITTIAGKFLVSGHTGDGGPATNALLYHPTAITVDNTGNIFFADGVGSYIRKIDPSGIITTVSGVQTVNCGVGDGGPFAQARFSAISAITFDQSGNLYISDYGCNTVRKVNTSGIVTTIAGNGTIGFSGDGGPATSAQLRYPTKVAIDNAGNVYIPDAQNHRIRKINTAGIITTIAGNGTLGYSGDGGPATNAQFFYPGSVVIDHAGNLFMADYNDVIRKIDLSGIISTYAGNGTSGYSGDGGPAILASMHFTEGRLTIDNNDNIYFVNTRLGNVIRKISTCLTASISQHPTNIIMCAPGNAAFNITASNATGYQWQLDAGSGWNNITDDATYSGANTSSLSITSATVAMTNYKYRCAVTNICGTIYSVAGLLTISSPVSPSLTITTSSTTNCEGAAVTFAAWPLNAGASPVFEWKKNGVPVGLNTRTYNDNQLIDGDVITCEMTSNANCLITNTAISNSLAMSVTTNLRPTLTITGPVNNICSGTPVTFTSSMTNGGMTPMYTWFHNGVNLFLNSPTYTPNVVNDGDIIMSAMLSNLTCVIYPLAVSQVVILHVTPSVSPSVTIAASATAICKNATVEFTASGTNIGSSPIYQWKKNGTSVGNNTTKYIDNNLNQTDIITCTIVSNADCLINTQATSNPISIIIHPDPVVSLDHTNTICNGGSKTLDAGNFNSYLWNTGSTGRTISINSTGIYSVIVTDKNGCTGTDLTNITTILPSPSGFLPADTAVCAYGDITLKPNGSFSNYLWNTGSSNSSITIKEPGQYRLQIRDDKGCDGSDTILVLPKECLQGFFMPTAFTPNHDGKNDLLKPILLGKVKQYQFRIFNRWGQLIFQTNELKKGWDGDLNNIKQDGGAFIWSCTYQVEGEGVQNKRGSFILIR